MIDFDMNNKIMEAIPFFLFIFNLHLNVSLFKQLRKNICNKKQTNMHTIKHKQKG